MGRLFPGGRNRPRGLSLIVDDDDDELNMQRNIKKLYKLKIIIQNLS